MQRRIPLIFRFPWEWMDTGRGTHVACFEGIVRAFQGSVYRELVPRIDGNRSADELVHLLRNEYGAAMVLQALQSLSDRGILADVADDGNDALYWWRNMQAEGVAAKQQSRLSVEILSIGKERGHAVAAGLARMGIAIGSGADFRIVIVEDYLDGALEEMNREALRARIPWIMARPSGRKHWIGPIYVPGRTACWKCLAIRIRANMLGAKGVQESSAAASATEARVALLVSRWMLTRRHESLESKLWTLDVSSPRTRTHRVVRLPNAQRVEQIGITPSLPIVFHQGGRLARP